MKRASIISMIISGFLALGIPAGNASARPDSDMNLRTFTETADIPASPIVIALNQTGTSGSLISFEYSVPVSGYVRVGLYNSDGLLAGVLVDTYREAGTYRAVWNISGCPAGVYTCVLSAGSISVSRTVVLQ